MTNTTQIMDRVTREAELLGYGEEPGIDGLAVWGKGTEAAVFQIISPTEFRVVIADLEGDEPTIMWSAEYQIVEDYVSVERTVEAARESLATALRLL